MKFHKLGVRNRGVRCSSIQGWSAHGKVAVFTRVLRIHVCSLRYNRQALLARQVAIPFVISVWVIYSEGRRSPGFHFPGFSLEVYGERG